MGQKKLIRFAAIKAFGNVLEYPEGMAGKWHTLFAVPQPLTLELACGKGEYALGLGRLNPQRNYLGVDVKGNRIYIGAKTALSEGLRNVAFMRTQIDRIAEYFAPNEVDEIWLTFPDPQLRTSRAKKRLTHPKFLRLYQQFLKSTGRIHLKTDSPLLYAFTKKVCGMYHCPVHEYYDDVYSQSSKAELLNIRTHYEGLDIAQSGRIHYICFSLPAVLPTETDEAFSAWVKEVEQGTATS